MTSPQGLAASWILSSALLTSCGSLPNGGAWGRNATLAPGWERITVAAVDALRDPWTWAPLAAAGLLQIDDLDGQISDWAIDEHPIYGSRSTAQRYSDGLMYTIALSAVGTSLLTNSGSDPATWAGSKARGVGLIAGANLISQGIAEGLKNATKRQRPSGGSGTSFPSGHATSAFTNLAWSSRTLAHTGLPRNLEPATRFALTSTAVAAAWARVEAGQHFPSDVLVGAALGNFIGSLAHNAFLGLPGEPQLQVGLNPNDRSLLVGFAWTF